MFSVSSQFEALVEGYKIKSKICKIPAYPLSRFYRYARLYKIYSALVNSKNVQRTLWFSYFKTDSE
jgi:hypothetical protein